MIDAPFSFLLASVLLCLAPGPDNLFVLTQSALYGRKSGILITLGLCTGLLVHTLAVVIGVAAIFKSSELAFTLLKTVGAIYLFYLAWGIFRTPSSALAHEEALKTSNITLFKRGVIMNVSNPKVSIFFLAFLPQFASPGSGSISTELFLLGILFIITALSVFGTITILASSIATRFRASPRIQQNLSRMAGSVFVVLALKLFGSEFQL